MKNQNRIEHIEFKKLKGLQDVDIRFGEHLTAIMGVNGVGKTTVIHALACLYQPNETNLNNSCVLGQNYKFPQFFTPNTDATWKDSELTAYFSIDDSKKINKTYSKQKDRWSPKYDHRPKRNVYYIGIETCLPEIEKINQSVVIKYSTEEAKDTVSKKVLKSASSILNINYELLTKNVYKNKNMIGVKKMNGLKYSSLSMGTGEQRIIKVLQTVFSATQHSLILIDEIDLLLHDSALRRLIKELFEIAKDKKLQIVFTTHSLTMMDLTQYVMIQYIHFIQTSKKEKQMQVYDRLTSELIYDLTDCNLHYTNEPPLKIYVEDLFSKGIVQYIAKELNMRSKISVMTFGSCENAFTLAAGLCLQEINLDNTLILLDGDCYRNTEDRKKRIQKVLTGNEENRDNMRNNAFKTIKLYNLPDGFSPEIFIHRLLIQTDQKNEIVEIARSIQAVQDNHDFIFNICKKLDYKENEILSEIAPLISNNPEWNEFIKPVQCWLNERKNL